MSTNTKEQQVFRQESCDKLTEALRAILNDGRTALPLSLAIPAEQALAAHEDSLRENAKQAQEPVAWRTFDGEGGYEYRTYEGNEGYADEWKQRNPRHGGWVEPLYAAPTEQAAQAVPADSEGPIADGWQLSIGSGHAGFGVYASMTEYPEEGAVFILAAPQPATQGGWKPVPVEPTKAMLLAAATVDVGPDADGVHRLEPWLNALWAAMLAAAPAAPAPEAQPQAQAAGQEPYTSERHFALREGHEHRAEEDYFSARMKFEDSIATRTAFYAGYVRGFDKGTELADARAALAQRQPLTDEQIDDLAEPFIRDLGGDHWYSGERGIRDDSDIRDFARAIERAHGIRGATTGEQNK